MALRIQVISLAFRINPSPTGTVLAQGQDRLKTFAISLKSRAAIFLQVQADMEVELSDGEKKVKSNFEAVCRKLNMDQDSMDAAWTSYDKIKDNYTLEVVR